MRFSHHINCPAQTWKGICGEHRLYHSTHVELSCVFEQLLETTSKDKDFSHTEIVAGFHESAYLDLREIPHTAFCCPGWAYEQNGWVNAPQWCPSLPVEVVRETVRLDNHHLANVRASARYTEINGRLQCF